MDNKYYERAENWLIKYLQELRNDAEKFSKKGYTNAKHWNEKFEMIPIQFLTLHCNHFPAYITKFYEMLKNDLILEENKQIICNSINFLKRVLYKFLRDLIDLEKIHIEKDAEYIDKFKIKI